MVDTAATQDMLTQAIPADDPIIRVDQLDRAAEMWMRNIDALIKLRHKGATKVSTLPQDVFKCVIERRFPKVFFWRYSEPYCPIDRLQDRHFPAIARLDYNNQLVTICERKLYFWSFHLRDGANCTAEGLTDNEAADTLLNLPQA